MIAEERLRGILNAADPDDDDDVEIRSSLAAALKDSSIDFTTLSVAQIASLPPPREPSLCEIRARHRAASRLSPGFTRRRRAFNHRSR